MNLKDLFDFFKEISVFGLIVIGVVSLICIIVLKFSTIKLEPNQYIELITINNDTLKISASKVVGNENTIYIYNNDAKVAYPKVNLISYRICKGELNE